MDFYFKIMGYRIFYILKRICNYESIKRDGVSYIFFELLLRLVIKENREVCIGI